MIREITQLGNPVLRSVAQPLELTDTDLLKNLVPDLLETLTEAKGVGIAAPQVGESKRVFIVASRPNERYPSAPLMEPMVIINPVILSCSDKLESGWEGCLSIPGIRGLVPRPNSIDVQYVDLPSGKLIETRFTDFVARIFQHEYDHLEGIVFLDRVASTKDIVTEQEYRRIAT